MFVLVSPSRRAFVVKMKSANKPTWHMFLQSILQLHSKRVEGQKKIIYKSLVVGKNAGGGDFFLCVLVCTYDFRAGRYA